MTEFDPRIVLVLDVLGSENIEDVSQSDFEKIEDNFICQAEEVLLDDKKLEDLKASGFPELAKRIGELKKASLAYNWGRENL